MDTIKIAGVVPESIVDGPGIRYVVFTQGCPHKCKGCHNPQTHDVNSGKSVNIDDLIAKITKNPLIKGVTISGGEPFLQAKSVSKLISKLKSKNYDIMVYTGYNYEYLNKNSDESNYYKEVLENTDVLVDGKFDLNLKNELINFRGSENQRLIDCKQSISEGKVVTVDL